MSTKLYLRVTQRYYDPQQNPFSFFYSYIYFPRPSLILLLLTLGGSYLGKLPSIGISALTSGQGICFFFQPCSILCSKAFTQLQPTCPFLVHGLCTWDSRITCPERLQASALGPSFWSYSMWMCTSYRLKGQQRYVSICIEIGNMAWNIHAWVSEGPPHMGHSQHGEKMGMILGKRQKREKRILHFNWSSRPLWR